MKIFSAAFASLAASIVLLATPAGAAPTSAQQQAIKASCQGDFRAHCSGVSPGGEAALQCLQTNVASLSAACQSAVNAVSGTPAPAAAPAPAATPAPAPAATSEPAPATTAPAAKAAPAPAAPAAQPAPAAPAVVMTPREEMRFVRQSCSQDYRALCRGVPMGGGNALFCLRANAASLSPACRGALNSLQQ